MGCLKPIISKKHDTPLPCGRCIFCLSEKRDSWTMRVSLEYQKATSAYFITLTYDEQHLRKINGIPTLAKSDLQGFLKRLRWKNEEVMKEYWLRRNKTFPSPKFKKMTYFAVGEYGDKFRRPHYHIIVFDLFSNTLKYLNELWTYGSIDLKIGKAGSIHYATGYVLKNQNQIENQTEKAILLASQKMGDWYVKLNNGYHHENLTAKSKSNGFTIGLPRIYREKIFTKEEREKMKHENLTRKVEEELLWITEKEKKGLDWDLYLSDQINQLYKNKLNTKKKRDYENF